MENALAIGAVMGPVYLVLGLSVLFYVNSWLEIAREWSKNHYVLIVGGILSLILGLLVINLYNVWEWNIWMIVTVSGWLMFLDSVFYFMAPGDWSKAVLRTFTNANWLYFLSLVLIVAGAALSYYVYLT